MWNFSGSMRRLFNLQMRVVFVFDSCQLFKQDLTQIQICEPAKPTFYTINRPKECIDKF